MRVEPKMDNYIVILAHAQVQQHYMAAIMKSQGRVFEPEPDKITENSEVKISINILARINVITFGRILVPQYI